MRTPSRAPGPVVLRCVHTLPSQSQVSPRSALLEPPTPPKITTLPFRVAIPCVQRPGGPETERCVQVVPSHSHASARYAPLQPPKRTILLPTVAMRAEPRAVGPLALRIVHVAPS